jgi:hypothetical protein
MPWRVIALSPIGSGLNRRTLVYDKDVVGGHEKDTRSGISGSSGIRESTTIITGMKLFD